MSYPPYPPGPGGYPYPNAYPQPPPPAGAAASYGFASHVNPYPNQQYPPTPQGFPYPTPPTSVPPYPGASPVHQPATYGGNLPYAPQPQQSGLSYPTQSYSSVANPSTTGQTPSYPPTAGVPITSPFSGTEYSYQSSNLPPSTTGAYSSPYSVPVISGTEHSYQSSNLPPNTTGAYSSPYSGIQLPSQNTYPTTHSPRSSTKFTHSAMYASTQGTVTEYQPFNPEEDAKVLRKAMKGLGTDEKAIIGVLAKRTNAQRQQIMLAYKTHFGRDLIKDLKSELSGRLEDVIVALMTPTAYFLAGQLHKATSGLGTDEVALIEILCPLSNREMREVNAAYYQLYHKPLEKHLIEDTSGHFRKLLVSLCMGNRSENPHVDHARALQDAKTLYEAGEARWGTDESTFNSILVTQSFPQLQTVFAEYQKMTGKRIHQSIKNEFSGDVERGLLAIVKCSENPAAYFAERLYHSMAGAGTDDRSLIRIVTSRCEIDMVQIKQQFQLLFGKTLESFIAGDTSGDYKRVLLALVQ